VAHDFNNLLVGVLGNADLALVQLPADSPARSFLSSIVHSAEQAGRMCQQLLAYAGRGETEISRFELGPLVEDLAGMLRGSLPNSCELVLALEPTPIWIEGDRTQIMQVLMNLVTNAADAIGDEPGTITVRTVTTDIAAGALSELRRARESELTPGPYACVHVEDTGSGMDADTLERIFEPFFTTKTEGHGLGLSAMLGIAERHGGGVRVSSELGRGSTFTMCLPQAEAS
jgi:signal transduction histidine kinase